MFEMALATAHGRTARPYTFMVSLAGQFGLIGLSILIPLVFVDAIPEAQWLIHRLPLVAPPGLDVRTEVEVQPSASRTAVRRSAAPARLYEPVKYPPKPAILVDPDEAPATGPMSGGYGVPYGLGDPQAALPSAIAEALRRPAPAPPKVAEQPPARPLPTQPPLLRIGGNVGQPLPLYTPTPEYPLLARQARIEGIVRLEAIVGTDGSIRSVKLVNGPALLVQAAIAAVRTWRYTPPTLNGDPIEILMNVEVKFNLGR